MCWGRVVKIIDIPPKKKKTERHQQCTEKERFCFCTYNSVEDFLLCVSFFFVQIHQTEMQPTFSYNNKMQQNFCFFKLTIKNSKHPLLIKVLDKGFFPSSIWRKKKKDAFLTNHPNLKKKGVI